MNQDAEDLDDGVKKLIGKTISHVWVDMNDGELEEQVYVKSLVSLDDTIACCARVIDKHLNVTWQET